MEHPLYPGGDAPALIALLGDTHGELTAVRRAADKAMGHTSLIVQLGDFGFWPGADGAAFLDKATRWLDRRDMTLCWIDGNHDWHDRLDELPIDPDTGLRQITDHIWHLPRGYRWDWNGTTWLALGGAVSVDQDHRTPGRSWWTQEAVTDDDVDRARAAPADVQLTHDVPVGVPTIDWAAMQSTSLWPRRVLHEAHVNRERLRTVTDHVRPDHLWHGHWHHRYRDRLTLEDGHTVQIEGLAHDGAPWHENLALADTTGALVPWPTRV